MFEYLLFDLDGTIFDTAAIEVRALRDLFEEYSLPYSDNVLKLYSQINEKLWKRFELNELTKSEVRLQRFYQLFSALDITESINTEEFASKYFKIFSTSYIPVYGAVETLHTLKQHYKIYVISNGCVDIQMYKLSKLNIADIFEDIFLSEDIGFAKPHNAFFDHVYKTIGSPPKSSVLVIGDSITADIEGGKNSGFKTCYVGDGECGISDYSIKSVSQISTILK